jgi:large subunit ribosomal protein L5e
LVAVRKRRRREGKTDYHSRKKLIQQDKRKYNTPKYRLVVRFTNTQCICQIVTQQMAGDKVVEAAYGKELTHYGLPVGHKNYTAAYCTGLLLARRLLRKLGLDETYEGQTEVDGEDYHVEPAEEGPRPFRAYLDVGLARTSTGARVFGALKGACDGGLDIPHNEKRFAGYLTEEKKLDTELHQGYLLGRHVAEYAENLEEEEPEKYKRQFAKYFENNINPTELEELIPEVHEKIRENPERQTTRRPPPPPEKRKRWKQRKLTTEERKANLRAKLEALKEMAD